MSARTTSPAFPGEPTRGRPTDETVEVCPLALRAPDAARALGLSERQLWTLTNSGQIPCVRFGARIVYPVDMLREWLTEQGRKSIRQRKTNPAP